MSAGLAAGAQTVVLMGVECGDRSGCDFEAGESEIVV